MFLGRPPLFNPGITKLQIPSSGFNTPVYVGYGEQASGVGTNTNVIINQDLFAGTLIVVAAKCGDASGQPGLSGATLGTDSFTVGTNYSASTTRLRFAYKVLTGSYGTGSSINCTFTNNTSVRQIHAVAITGGTQPQATVLGLDGSGATATSSSPSITTGTFSQSTGIVFAHLWVNSPATVDPDPWTVIGTSTTPDNKRYHLVYRFHTDTNPVTYNPTISSSQLWGLNYISFKD